MHRFASNLGRVQLVLCTCCLALAAACTGVKPGAGEQTADDAGVDATAADDAILDAAGDTGWKADAAPQDDAAPDAAGTDAAGTDAAGTDALDDTADAAGPTDATLDAGNDIEEVTIDVPPAPGGVTIKVVDAGGLAVSGALVTLPTTATTTGADGLAVFAQVPVGDIVVKIAVSGYAPAASKVTVASGTVASQVLTVNAIATQQTVTATAPVAVQSASVGVALPANAFVDSSGTAVTADVQVSVSPIDPTTQSLTAAPGPLVGVATGSSQSTPLETAFMADVSFSAGGQPVTLAAGVKADLSFQLPAATAGNYTVGQELGAWWFDLSTGTWKQDGVGTVGIDQNGNKTFSAKVSHFTWWMGALPINDTACLHVNVTNGGQPVSGIQVMAKGISYSAISKGTTGPDGSVCLESKVGGSAMVFIQDPVLTQIGGMEQVVADATVLACSATETGCKIVDIAVQAPNACTDASINCDDQNPCTTDTCEAPSGVCAHAPANGSPCDDGNACTTGDTCNAGACSSNQITCNDGNPCTTDSCDTLTGCVITATPDSAPCDDWNACTVGDMCVSGKCQSGANTCTCTTDLQCDDGNICTLDACTSGKCTTIAAATGTGCDDHSACTTGDACNSGWCYGASAVVCNDGLPCTLDLCDAKLGCFTKFADGLACDDGDVCTSGDTCTNGLCAGTGTCTDVGETDGGAIVDAGGCVGTCDVETPDAGPTDAGAVKDGGAIFDGGGLLDSGTTVDAGGPADGGATNPCGGKPDGATCDDGNACTTNDVCQKQMCISNSPSKCDDTNPCTMDSCDPMTGACTHQNFDGMSCEDGNGCTKGDVCMAGACKPGVDSCPSCTLDSQCDDKNPCTTDACVALKCSITFNAPGAACDDGNACTGPDACISGNCTGAPSKCDDGNVCTMDSCDPISGCKSVSLASGTTCATGDLCIESACQASACTTVKNLCVGNCGNGVCDSGETETSCPKDCQPVVVCGNMKCEPTESPLTCGFDCSGISSCAQTNCSGPWAACSKDSLCVAAVNCMVACGSDQTCTSKCQSNLPPPTASTLSAGAACINATCSGTNAVCGNGKCEASESPQSCPADCQSSGPCATLPDGSTCTDNNACTTDVCMKGQCIGTPISCDDGNACTMDACMMPAGCTHTVANGMACEDGNGCTQGDLCAAGVCKSGTNTCGACTLDAQCDDKNPCTVDKCGANNICTITFGAAGTSCSDGNACTTGDVCDPSGKCYGSPAKCDDGNVCTNDGCDPLSGCTVTALASGTTCTTGDLCSISACELSSCTVQQNLCVGNCGNGVCDSGETSQTCPKDCGIPSTCGDMKCGANESPTTCAFDCAANFSCPMQSCNATWAACGQAPDCVTAVNCMYNCGNDQTCQKNCTTKLLPATTPIFNGLASCISSKCSASTTCGNGMCEAGESNATCPQDCPGSVCGNGICEAGESPSTCPPDCGVKCGNGICEPGETTTSCPIDCGGGTCGDGICSGTETPITCPKDCSSTGPCTGLPDGSTCTDSNPCTADTCLGGMCVSKVLSCDDGNSCTMDACMMPNGCTHTVANGMGCEDGNACTQGDVCVGNVCTSGSNKCVACTLDVQCDDKNSCTTDKCGLDNICAITFDAAGTSCSDGNACTTGDVCNSAGNCMGMPAQCDDGNNCTSDGCNPMTGCTVTPLANGVTCTTGDLCTISACESSSCTVQQNLCVGNCGNGTCDAGETSTSCPKDCVSTAKCGNGICEPGESSLTCPPDCSGGSSCTGKPNGSTCNDNNACTQGDSCLNNVCMPGGTNPCDDGNVCTDNACNPVAGCSGPVFNTSPCPGGTCSAGVCSASAGCGDGICEANENSTTCPMDCIATSCIGLADGTTCTDGNACTQNDTCQANSCVPGAAMNCDDGNVCTDNSCDVTKGCMSQNNSASCPNGTCSAGICAANLCQGMADGTACDDGNACTVGDVCLASACTPGAAKCNDSNPCTTDMCTSGMCMYLPIHNGTTCP